MAHDVKQAIRETMLTLEKRKVKMKMTCSSFLYKFTPRDQDRLVTLVSKYSRAGHEQTTVKNCKYVIAEIVVDVSDNTTSLQETLDLQLDAIAIIFPLVKDRFSSLAENEVFQAMKLIVQKMSQKKQQYS